MVLIKRESQNLRRFTAGVLIFIPAGGMERARSVEIQKGDARELPRTAFWHIVSFVCYPNAFSVTFLSWADQL